MKDITTYLTESIVVEADVTQHLIDRFNGRITSIPSDAIQNKIKRQIMKNLKKVKDFKFDPYKSYGIRLAELQINKDSKMFYEIGGREYYRIDDFLGKDSTGDEIWVVVRNNKIGTIMLRKSIQPIAKLRVDSVLYSTKELEKIQSF